ncbi:LysR substrate-binding domain-containing protein [Deinococcus xianganensis]|uniref:LysR family transcriptional regulator n=1 Tax=Deinococcus xianganensis TaxID=1507289 RepID=A0A6I4YS11_9DEIO|nr:LysR family transcriptional regulator [Deinococcus xianganensis]
MRINPEHLVTFSVVAELGSVSRAGQALNLSQPAVSGQLRALQDQFGQPLYVRQGRGVALTEAGERLLPHAQAIARNLAEVAGQISGARQRPAAALRVGLSFALSEHASALVRRARTAGLHLRVVARPAGTLIEEVRAGRLGAALIVTSPQRSVEDLDLHRVGEDQLRLVTPPGHPLAGLGYVAPHALRGETLLWSARGSGVRRQAERLLDGVGLSAAQGLELGSLWGVLAGVRAGDGVAIMPAGFVARDVQLGAVASVGLEAPAVTVAHTLVTAPAALLSAEVRALVALLRTS